MNEQTKLLLREAISHTMSEYSYLPTAWWFRNDNLDIIISVIEGVLKEAVMDIYDGKVKE